MKFEWELVTEDNKYRCTTKRAQVFGGWIVLNTTRYDAVDKHTGKTDSMVFLPDVNHEWKID